MKTQLKRIAVQWCPPALLPLVRNVLGGLGLSAPNRLCGRFLNWQEAERVSTTYAAPVILERVAAGVAKLLSGAVAYERDSVTFAQVEWPWPLLAALGRQAARDGGSLRVLDFGGSLGGTYIVARRFFAAHTSIRWHVVEQPHYVAKAAELPFPEDIAFFSSISAAVEFHTPNVVIASGVLHYLPRPFEVLSDLVKLDAGLMVIDRTPCVNASDDIITVQHVPSEIFPASYPSWLFARQRILDAVTSRYREVATFDGGDQMTFENNVIACHGWLFERNNGT